MPSPASALVERPSSRTLRSWGMGLAAWFGVMPVLALQNGLAFREAGMDTPWGSVFADQFDQFVACVPLLPLLAWGVRRYPIVPGRLARHACVLLLCVIAASALRNLVVVPAILPIIGKAWEARVRMGGIVMDALIYAVVVAVLHGKLYYDRFRAQELEAAHLAQRLAETQLAALRSQLQPHFLFNTLNAISALVPDDPETADRMLTRLADLLRMVLEPPPGDEHTLAEELVMVDRYLEIMRLRFGPRLSTVVDAPLDLRDVRVPWLVLQPLVENAFEHGVGRRRGEAEVRVRAWQDPQASGETTVVIAVENSGLGSVLTSGEVPSPVSKRKRGIGMKNTARRLRQLYGDAASLDTEPLADGGFRATVRFPLRREAISAWTMTDSFSVSEARLAVAGVMPPAAAGATS